MNLWSDGILLIPNRGLYSSPGQNNSEPIADGIISLVSEGNVNGIPQAPELRQSSMILFCSSLGLWLCCTAENEDAEN